MTELNLISWNVNGIRAVIKKDFIESIKSLNPDILCVQETKAYPEQVDHDIDKLGYKYEYWNSAEKKGYSGTTIFSKIKPINVILGIGIEELDKEGRVITAEFENFFLVNVYTPNSKRGLKRLDFRYKIWDVNFLAYIKKLELKKPVIFCGDLNVAHKNIDIKNFKTNQTTLIKPGSAGFTDKERQRFQDFLDAGFIDTFRYFYPDKKEVYSWWSYMFNSRKNNTGWRIDYFCVSKSLKNKLVDAQIYTQVMGSDHCPVGLKIDFEK